MTVFLRGLHRVWGLCGRHRGPMSVGPHSNRWAPSAVGTASAASYHQHSQGAGRSSDDVEVINLRSDTFTLPTAAMREAMITAQLGDDVYGEDPTVNKLQEECAELLGKEAALLVPTGTMGNISSILSHRMGRFEEILLGDQSHIYLYEVGGTAALAGVHPRAVRNKDDGTLDLQELEGRVRDRSDSHYPWTTAICLENTHNKTGGKVLPLDYIQKVRAIADAHGLVMHLDGARLMNAATALQVPPSHITQHFDSISMCFSKGLSCPVGSIVAGSRDFIDRALRARKALGGAMRQAGVIAAPMLVALKEIVPLLKEDHARAQRIAQAVADLGEETVLSVDVESVHTNIVMLHTSRADVSAAQVAQRLMQVTEAEVRELGGSVQVLAVPFSPTTLRLVTYNGITDDHVEKAVRKMLYVLKEMASRL